MPSLRLTHRLQDQAIKSIKIFKLPTQEIKYFEYVIYLIDILIIVMSFNRIPLNDFNEKFSALTGEFRVSFAQFVLNIILRRAV